MSQADMDRLRRAVAANTNLIDSLIKEKQGLAQQMRDSADDADEIRELADILEADAAKNAAAAVSSTPVEGTPAAALPDGTVPTVEGGTTG